MILLSIIQVIKTGLCRLEHKSKTTVTGNSGTGIFYRYPIFHDHQLHFSGRYLSPDLSLYHGKLLRPDSSPQKATDYP
jgi:hypothetical protein